MSRYNLVDEKWIPVRDLDGNLIEPGLGILETLLNAEQLSVIEDPSPLVTASLYRFLLAVLYRALKGPCDIDEAKKLFLDGLPKEKIREYLEELRPRFWLFDERYPFGQIPDFKPKTWRSWTAIAAEHNADTAKVLFDHVDVMAAGSIPLHLAIRWLLGTHTFSVSTGKSELAHTGDAPSAGSLMAIPIGRNLLDTLLFCLVPETTEIFKNDIPIWERDPETIEYLTTSVKIKDKKTGKMKDRAMERTATGLADLYTWRSRSIILKLEETDSLKQLGLASGIGYVESKIIDPMEGYVLKDVTDEATKEKMEKPVALRFEERGVWRDFDSLLPDEAHLAPKAIENAIELTRRNKERMPKGVLVLGQRHFPPRPNLAFWRSEFFILPNAIQGDKYIRSYINSFLLSASETDDILYRASYSFAKDLLTHGDRKVDTKDIRNFIDQIPALAYYWSTLESAFHQVLRDFSIEKDPDDIHHDWLIAVRNALSDAWGLHERSTEGGDAWTIRALVKAGGIIGGKIIELNEKIEKLSKNITTPILKEVL